MTQEKPTILHPNLLPMKKRVPNVVLSIFRHDKKRTKTVIPPTDADLVRRVLDGDLEAFDEIDRRYREPLGRFLHRYTMDRNRAEELCQRTLIRAYEMLRQLESPDRLAGWLHRIAFRMAAAEGRRKKMVSLETVGIEVVENFDRSELERNEESQNLWATARRELSPEEYRTLLLRYRDGLSPFQIAETMNKKEGAVRVQLHRARKKLLPFFETKDE